jgi:hypothetical protein
VTFYKLEIVKCGSGQQHNLTINLISNDKIVYDKVLRQLLERKSEPKALAREVE